MGSSTRPRAIQKTPFAAEEVLGAEVLKGLTIGRVKVGIVSGVLVDVVDGDRDFYYAARLGSKWVRFVSAMPSFELALEAGRRMLSRLCGAGL